MCTVFFFLSAYDKTVRFITNAVIASRSEKEVDAFSVAVYSRYLGIGSVAAIVLGEELKVKPRRQETASFGVALRYFCSKTIINAVFECRMNPGVILPRTGRTLDSEMSYVASAGKRTATLSSQATTPAVFRVHLRASQSRVHFASRHVPAATSVFLQTNIHFIIIIAEIHLGPINIIISHPPDPRDFLFHEKPQSFILSNDPRYSPPARCKRSRARTHARRHARTHANAHGALST